MKHHEIDVWTEPKDKSVRFINETELIDRTLLEYCETDDEIRNIDKTEDNIRVYVPLDINKGAILRRISSVIRRYGEATEENEMLFSSDIQSIISQLEIYDQIWFVREYPEKGKHSRKALELAENIINKLEDISVIDAELFPMDIIEELTEEYLNSDDK